MENHDEGSVRVERTVRRDTLLFAALLLNRLEPMAPHHAQAIRERLGYKTDEELLQMIRTGDA